MHSTNKSRCGASRTPGQRSLFFALGRKNEAMCREVARAKAIGEPLTHSVEWPSSSSPSSRPSSPGSAAGVAASASPPTTAPRALRRVQPDRVLPPPRRLRAQAHVLATTRGAAGEDDVQRWHWEQGGHRAAFAGMAAEAKAKHKEEAAAVAAVAAAKKAKGGGARTTTRRRTSRRGRRRERGGGTREKGRSRAGWWVGRGGGEDISKTSMSVLEY